MTRLSFSFATTVEADKWEEAFRTEGLAPRRRGRVMRLTLQTSPANVERWARECGLPISVLHVRP